MGGVWCRADRGSTYDSKGPLSSTVSRWTDHVRQAYRKPKIRHRPPKPPERPIRTNDRLSISHPHLVTSDGDPPDGWRTATLIVPQEAPVPPPRKKRKPLQELTRVAFSMDNLNSPIEDLKKSTLSLQEKFSFGSGLDSNGSSTTTVVSPDLESRNTHTPATVGFGGEKHIKEDEQEELKNKPEVQSDDGEFEDTNEVDLGDEIVPIEKENMFIYRTVLHSNLGYVDKLSAISEVSAESGFDDRTDVGKFSERSESLTSDESDIRDVEETVEDSTITYHKTEYDVDVREMTAKRKKEWMENILKEESEPYFLLVREDLESKPSVMEVSSQPNIYTNKTHDLNHLTTETFKAGNIVNKTNPMNSETTTVNSTFLEGWRGNNDSSPISQPFVDEGESIFLTNMKTNIIYKSLSSDNLRNAYANEYPKLVNENTLSSKIDLKGDLLDSNFKYKITITSDSNNPFNHSTCITQSDLLTRPNINDIDLINDESSNSYTDIVVPPLESEKATNTSFVKTVTELKPTDMRLQTTHSDVIVHHHTNNKCPNELGNNKNDDKLNVKDPTKPISSTSSRRSSLTDSLQEFEISIYDMLKESNKYEDSSDDDESVQTLKTVG